MPGSPPDSIAFLAVDLARLLRQGFEKAVASEGLDVTAGEARTLYHIALLENARQSALAERMRVEPMTLSNFLDRLEERELIVRQPDPEDRRAKRISLTRKAGPLVERIATLAAEVRKRATTGLSAAEVEAFRHALQLMRRNLSDAEGAATR